MESTATVKKIKRYEYQIDGRIVDFKSVIPIPASKANVPIWLAKNVGLLKLVSEQALPAIWESRKV